MDGLYGRQEIADRLEVSLDTVRRILGATKPGRVKVKVTDEVRRGVLELRGKATIPAIAAQFEIGEATVSRVFKAAGLAGRVARAKRARVRKEPPAKAEGEKQSRDYVRKVTPEIRQRIIELRR